MGKSTPSAPDPYATAQAQSQANIEAANASARLNAVNQYGPYGSSTYQRRADGTPISQTVTLNALAQGTLDGQMSAANTLASRANSLLGQVSTGPMDISGLPQRQTSVATSAYAPTNLPNLPGVNSFGTEAKTAQDASYNKAMSLMQPEMDQARQALVQTLSDRGIPLDSAAGQAELNRLDQAQVLARNQAAYDAVSAGSQEQSRLYNLASDARQQLYNEGLNTVGFNNNQALQAASFNNQQRSDALQEALTLRNQPINEAMTLLGGSSPVQVPGFQSNAAYSVQSPDITSLINSNYQNQLNTYNNQQKGLWGAVGNIGAALLGLGLE